MYEKVHAYVEYSGLLHKDVAKLMDMTRFYLPMFLRKETFSLEDLEKVASVIECKLEDLYNVVDKEKAKNTKEVENIDKVKVV